MHPELRRFLAQLARTVVATLVPVLLVTFISVPVNLGRHPGDAVAHAPAPAQHMT